MQYVRNRLVRAFAHTRTRIYSIQRYMSLKRVAGARCCTFYTVDCRLVHTELKKIQSTVATHIDSSLHIH